MTPRKRYLLHLIHQNPGINCEDLSRFYNAGFPLRVDIASTVYQLLGEKLVRRGKARNSKGRGLYVVLPGEQVELETVGKQCNCVKLLCAKHRQKDNERRANARTVSTNS